ncbi:helix-turn-helix domain-containing protein [Rhizobium rhizogenes]|uniref:helix-turn-helix domain-containing protein n=1 Tax=Rhizobium rhizogenes TaxID=359 RepID=UPI000646BA21|nr:helix-turn-helix transcriptional regulator [Rhizobium rhizogenes]
MSNIVTSRKRHNASTDASGCHPVDIYVGQQIRLARKEQRMSQEALAKCLGVTFQQVQKYEIGANRVSASKLFEIATALQRPVSYFFEGFLNAAERNPTDAERESVTVIQHTAEGRRLAKAFVAAMPQVRKAVVGLLESME